VDTKYLAGLVGPTMIAIAVSEALNLHIFANIASSTVYLNGTLLFVAGLSIVRFHNRWTCEWPVLLTLVGWLALLLGLYRMFAPEAQQMVDNAAAYAALVLLFAVGCILAFKAYRLN
jgi:hypothetical protein